MRKIRVAQIGTSRYSHGNDIFSTLVKHPEVFDIAGFALPEGEKELVPSYKRIFAGYKEMSVQEIMDDETIEAVIIETEEIHLTKYALWAARQGKHIHMEKPGGLSLGDFEALVATARENNLVFHTGYMYRYNPVISDILHRVHTGQIGRIISVEAQMSGWRPKEQTQWLETFPGGMMFFLGCHLIDLVLQLQGKPDRIIPFHKCSGVYDIATKDLSAAVFEYPNGISFIKTTQAERGGFLKRRLIITGTEGRFEVCPLEVNANYPLQYTEYDECKSTDWNAIAERKRSEPYDRYDTMMLSFAKMVRGEQKNPYSYEYELDLFKTILKCCE